MRLGAFHDVLDSFTVWAAVLSFSIYVTGLPDSFVFTTGASYKFSLGFGI